MVSNGQLLDSDRGVAITEAALSLCALGGRPVSPHRSDPDPAPACDRRLDGNEIIERGASGCSRGRKKNGKKLKDPRRGTSIDEMIRLMRVYGPIKCQRDRTERGSRDIKPGSVRRKFYRWFPDFNERFEKTKDGWFAPKAGHQREMEYREGLRREDEGKVTSKRRISRISNGFARPDLSHPELVI